MKVFCYENINNLWNGANEKEISAVLRNHSRISFHGTPIIRCICLLNKQTNYLGTMSHCLLRHLLPTDYSVIVAAKLISNGGGTPGPGQEKISIQKKINSKKI